MPSTSKRRALGLLVVIAVAVGVRVLYALEIRHTPFYHSPVIDAEFYHQLAQALASGEGTGRAPFMMPPLYPLVLSVLYRLVGVDLDLAHVLQFVLGCVSVVLTFLLARRLAGPAVAVISGLLVATNPALLFIEGDLLATPLAILLDLAFLLLLLQNHETRRGWSLGAAAIVLGLAALARPPALVVLPFFATWMAWRQRRPRAAVILVLLTLATLLPVSVHNQRASGEWVWISANGGINFWIGNNPDWRHTVALRPGPEWRRMNDLPLREEGRTTPVQRDRWFWRQALQGMAADPLGAVQRLATRSVLLLHDHQLMRDFDFYFFRAEYSKLLWLPTGSFAMLLSLALIGTFLARPRLRHRPYLWLFVLPYAASIVAFFVTARYRAPLLPLLAIPAAAGIVWLWQAIRHGRWRQLLPAVLVSSIVCLVSLPDWFGVDRVDEVESRYRIAKAIENSGDLQAALAAYREVLQQDPSHALAAARAAGCEQRLGRVQEAVARYERLLDRHPDYVEVMVNLANLAWRFGDAPTAQGYFELAQQTDPWYAQAYGYHGMFRASRGEHRQALRLYEEALRLDPSWDQLRVEKARSLWATGAIGAARATLEEVPPSLARRSAAVQELQGDLSLAMGRQAEALRSWRRALELEPRNARLMEKLQRLQGP